MKRSPPCPKCQTPLDLTAIDSAGKVSCSKCGARFKTNRKNATAAAPTSPPLDDFGLPAFPGEEGDFANLPAASPPYSPTPAPQPLSATQVAHSAAAISQDEPTENRHRLPIILAAGGGGLLALVLVGVLVWSLFTGRAAKLIPPGLADMTGAVTADGKIADASVTFDRPLNNVRPDIQKAAPSIFVPATPLAAAQPSLRQKLIPAKLPNPNEAMKPATSIPLNDPPAWKAEIDSPPADSSWSIAPRVRIDVKIWRYEILKYRYPYRPVVADMNGPFVLMPATWDTNPYEVQVKNPNSPDMELSINETPQPPIAVMDLRSGMLVGEFDWRVPFWATCALSPDGEHLIGPYHVPLMKYSALPSKEVDALAALYLWKRDTTATPIRIPANGEVKWYGFVGKDLVAVLSDAKLQVCEVGSGELRFELDLPYRPVALRQPNSGYDKFASIQEAPRHHFVVVSPGAKYLAVVGNGVLAMVSVAEQRILGTVNLELRQDPWTHVAFTLDGSELLLAWNVPRSTGSTRISVFDAADGRRKSERIFEGQTEGPIFKYDDRTFIVGGGTRGAGTTLYFTEQQARGRTFSRFSQLLSLPATGRMLVSANIYADKSITSTLSREREELFEEIGPPNGGETKEEHRIIEVDEAQSRMVDAPPVMQPTLPAWTAASSSTIKTLPYRPSRTSAGERVMCVLTGVSKKAFVRGKGTHSELSASWSLIDAMTGNSLGEPVTFREWRVDEENASPDQFAFAKAIDDRWIAVVDPEALDRIDLFKPDGTRLFGFHPFGNDTPVEWIEFAKDGKLIASGDGDIAAIEVGDDFAKVVYRTTGDYLAPFGFMPDRQHFFASRGNSFDILDASTGACLTRLGIEVDGVISDIALSPDGKRLAAIYTNPLARLKLVQHLEAPGDFQGHIAVWDLPSATVGSTTATVGWFATLAWASPEHLCLANRSTSPVFDLKLNTIALSYKPSISGPNRVERTADGRVWRYDAEAIERNRVAEREGRAEEPVLWKVTTLSDRRTSEEAPFYAADRKLISFDQTPIQFEINAGKTQRSKEHGEKLLAELQKRGYVIGPSGWTLRMKPQIGGSGDTLEFSDGKKKKSEMIPRVNYNWQLVDAQGTIAWQGQTFGRFVKGKSKYYAGSETRSGRVMSRYDFGSLGTEAAIVDEILELGTGLTIPEDLPRELLMGSGRYVTIPVTLPWSFAAN